MHVHVHVIHKMYTLYNDSQCWFIQFTLNLTMKMILITNNKITFHHCPSHNILFSQSYKNKKIIKHSVLFLQTKNALVLSLSLQKFIQSGLLYTHVPISQPYFRLRGTCMYFYSTHTHTVKGHARIHTYHNLHCTILRLLSGTVATLG